MMTTILGGSLMLDSNPIIIDLEGANLKSLSLIL